MVKAVEPIRRYVTPVGGRVGDILRDDNAGCRGINLGGQRRMGRVDTRGKVNCCSAAVRSALGVLLAVVRDLQLALGNRALIVQNFCALILGTREPSRRSPPSGTD